MDYLGAFESYVMAVQTGSLSGAARRRGVSQSAISQQIAGLEAKYDTPLLTRARSGVQMTQAGEIFYDHACAILSEHGRLLGSLSNLADTVSGRLVVTANLGYSQHILSDAIIDMIKRYPELEIILRPDTRILDLVEEGIDIALRSGSAGSGGGVVQKIATMSVCHAATPEYLDRMGRPQKPEDLINLDYIQFKAGDDQISTVVQRGKEQRQVSIKTGFTAQFPDLIVKAMESSMGYAKMPEFFVADALQDGRLEVVLPHWQPPPTELFLVFQSSHRRARKYGVFLDILFDHLERKAGVTLLSNTKHLRAM